MRQLALVLIDNARRYAATGKFVRCTTGVHDEQPFLAIADKGPGFPSGIEAHGIDLFWRAEPSRARMTAAPVSACPSPKRSHAPMTAT
jgi:two-component system sensor histidine kinase AdeS